MSGHETAIRDARPDDLEAIFAIYNAEVSGGTATFDTVPLDPERDSGWLADRDPAHPVLVAERAGGVIGFASLSPWSSKGAYRRTAEVSVYVSGEHRGSGAGRALLEAIIARAPAGGIAVLLARIAEGNPVSVALHERAGFRRFGIQRRCGEKFGRVLDVELLDLHLD